MHPNVVKIRPNILLDYYERLPYADNLIDELKTGLTDTSELIGELHEVSPDCTKEYLAGILGGDSGINDQSPELNDIRGQVIMRLYMDGRMDMVKWIVDTYPSFNAYIGMFLIDMPVETTKSLIQILGITGAHLSSDEISQLLVEGSRETIKWLFPHLCIARDQILQYYCSPVAACCAYSFRKFEWLVDTYQLTIGHMRSVNVLRTVIHCGVLPYLKWLTRRFEFSKDDLQLDDELDSLLLPACERVSLNTIKHLVKGFNLTELDIKQHRNAALIRACSSGNIDLIKYLAGTFICLPIT